MRTFIASALLVAFALVPSVAADPCGCCHGTPAPAASRLRVRDLQFLGETSFSTGTTFGGTAFGGLSGLTYDAAHGRYYAISDDRSQLSPARFYTLSIDVSDGHLDAGDVAITGVTTLLDAGGAPFAPLSLDPEGIALDPSGAAVWVSSEGDASLGIAPFVREFRLSDGRQIAALPVASRYLPAATTGIRNNLAFESLAITPDQRTLVTATENALKQDGPASDVANESLSRILFYDLATATAAKEAVYEVERVPAAPIPEGSFAANGLVELLATDSDGSFLALERAFSNGVGFDVRLYEIRSQGALDVIGVDELAPGGVPLAPDPVVPKRQLSNIGSLGVVLDNLEAMALGPVLPGGRRLLVVASDNNFSATQVTQFLAFSVAFDEIPAVAPTLETPATANDKNATTPLKGDSDDPAIWVHPTDPSRSLVIVSLKDGGLAVFDLDGVLLQKFPAAYGSVRYNNVDLLYQVRLGLVRRDLAVVSDRKNDTIVVFAIDPATRLLSDVTSPSMPGSIFGIDDGTHTAYGLGTWEDPATGRLYAFTTQRSSNHVAQVELFDDGTGRVSGHVVRTITLPVPTGDPEDSQSEGVVVDQDLGRLYVGMEHESGVLVFDAHPAAGNAFTVLVAADAPFVAPDLEGLTIYYAGASSGYVLVSSQGDSTFAVFDRLTNDYLGSFVIGARDGIDRDDECDGAHVSNLPLGPRFPCGLLVVQDGANDPQITAEDDDELENIATNFKYVRWDAVAASLDLDVCPRAHDPRGTLRQQIARARSDVAALEAAGRLRHGDASSLDAAFASIDKHATAGRTDALVKAVDRALGDLRRLAERARLSEAAAKSLAALLEALRESASR